MDLVGKIGVSNEYLGPDNFLVVYNCSKGTILSMFDENSPSYLVERGKTLSNYKAAKAEMVDMHEKGQKVYGVEHSPIFPLYH